jgi:hypothetical protein
MAPPVIVFKNFLLSMNIHFYIGYKGPEEPIVSIEEPGV